MSNKVLSGILIFVLMAITSTLVFFGYGYFKAFKTDNEAEEYLKKDFEELIVDLNQNTTGNENETNEITDPTGNNQNNTGNSNGGNNNQNSGYYKGYKVAGKLEMPTINKQFPILDEPEKAKAMDVSVVKVYGPELNTVGNVFIGGHNNNNGTLFSKNKNLNVGDKIYITDLSGKRVSYTIYDKFYTPGSDNTWFNRKSEDKVEVTLYTCDSTGANRLIICARADE